MAILDGNYWFSDASGDAPLPIADIGQSLRFRGAQNLTHVSEAGNRKTFTMSFWAKLGDLTAQQTLFQHGNAGTSDNLFYIQWLPSPSWGDYFNIYNYNAPTNTVNLRTSGAYRDSNAWYHFVLAVDTTQTTDSNRVKFYINGVQEPLEGNTQTWPAQDADLNVNFAGGTFAIGSSASSTGYFEGYQAGWYFIDGQALEPTAFGLFDEEGVWVPRQVDFTPATERFSDNVVTYTGAYDANGTGTDFISPAVNGFDGDTSTFVVCRDADNSRLQVNNLGLTGVTGLRLNVMSTQEFRVNGTVESFTGNAGNTQPTWVTIDNPPADIDEISLLSVNNGRCRWSAIEVTDANGTSILTNPFIWSSQVFSSDATTIDWDTTSIAGFAAADPGNYGRDRMFDGQAGGAGGSNGQTDSQSWVAIFRPDTPIEVTSLRICPLGAGSGTYPVYVNGDDTTPVVTLSSGATPSFQDIPFTGTLTSLMVGNSTTSAMTSGWQGIEINGGVLVDGVNNSYGTNGFHLTFSDSNDLGADNSGNNNNFTPSGFNTDPVGIFSNDLFTNPGTATPNWNTTDTQFAAPGGAATGAFDGNNNTEAGTLISPNTGTWVIWRPSTPIVANSSVQVTTRFNESIFVNEVDTGLNAPASSNLPGTTVDLSPSLTFPITIESIGLRGNSSGANASEGRVTNFIIDGTEYVDNTGEDYDLMQDSPSQNYATLNPLQQPPLENLTNANLNTASTGISSSVAPNGTVNVPINGRVYVEFRCESVNGSYPRFGFSKLRTSDSNAHTTGDWAVNPTGGIISVASSQNAGITFGAGDVVCIAWDRQANKAWFAVNGNVDTSTAGITLDQAFTDEEVVFAVVFNARNTNVSSSAINFGQQPFVGQVPAGFSVLQTQNLPAAPIPNGTDHFRALTAPGASILDVARANLNGYFDAAGFAQGLWWIKDMDNVNQHQLLDSVRGGTDAILSPSLNAATAYSAPTGDSAAWCWNAPDTWASTDADITAGTLASSGRRNKEAGFSIINFTGNATAGATIAHGLDEAPEFFILKPYTAGNTQIYVYSTAEVGNQSAVFLNSSGSKVADSNIYWNSTSPNQNFITLGSAATTNATTPVSIYAWHSVPGYSAFGSYAGNDDSDGVFVYTGFRPAFVMFKTVNTSADWIIYDTTRNPTNPVDARLMPSRDLEERTSTGMHVDFLSNGFKHRNQELDLNNNFTYIYAAFASNPFGGSNVNPNTAALTGPPQISGITAGISKSLRFKGAQSLNRAFAQNNQTTFTASFWFKRGEMGTSSTVLCMDDGANNIPFDFLNTDVIRCFPGASGGSVIDTTAVFRDPSAWYHFCFNSTTMWINGQVVMTGDLTASYAASNDVYIGQYGINNINHFDGYIADFYLVDGTNLDATTFGELNDDGVWVPIAEPTINDYGANGCKLVMDPAYQNGTTLLDQSGNGNDFTMTGFDTDDYFGEDFDWMKDGPSQNYATYNPLGFNNGALSGSITLEDANLGYTISSNPDVGFTIFTIPRTGKYYFESRNPSEFVFRLYAPKEDNASANNVGVTGHLFNQGTRWLAQAAALTPAGQVAKTGPSNTQVVIDADNHRIYLGDTTNDQWLRNDGGGTYTMGTFDSTRPSIDYSGLDEDARNNAQIAVCGTSGGNINFGQQPFSFTIPSGWSNGTVFQTQSLPAATITDGRDHLRVITGPGEGGYLVFRQPLSPATTAQSAANLTDQIGIASSTFTAGSSSDAFIFDTVEEVTNTQVAINSAAGGFWGGMTVQGYVSLTGEANTWTQVITNQFFDVSAANTVTIPAQAAAFRFIKLTATTNSNSSWGTNDGTPILEFAQNTFPNGLWWIKDRDNSNQHQLVDSVRGGNTAIQCPSKNVAAYAAPAGNSVAWCWNVGTDTGVTNNDGSTQSTVFANAAAGFSIVQWTGTQTVNTVGHGLGATPSMLIVKGADAGNTNNIAVNVRNITNDSNRQVGFLNSTDALFGPSFAYFNDTPPNETVFTVSTGGDVNVTGETLTAYCWTPIPGYSAFGSYEGNGDADGPFIYTGFRPAFVMVKRINADANWTIWDTTRNPTNPVGLRLQANTANDELDAVFLDVVSNGFKFRNSGAGYNTTGGEYIYCSFAENPFGGSNTVPVTAR